MAETMTMIYPYVIDDSIIQVRNDIHELRGLVALEKELQKEAVEDV